MSESVMISLARKGMDRQDAHELLRKLTLVSESEKKPFLDVLVHDKFVTEKLNENELVEALNPKNYIGTAIKQAESFSKRKV